LPISPFSAISAAFVARLIKGCRGDVPVRVFLNFGKPEHNQRSHEHFAARAALAGGLPSWL
jgi:hypothetical protein